MRNVVLVAHNIRSIHNVGSLLRTADGLGIEEVLLTGYTPYPIEENDSRLPHIANRINQKINKVALGAQNSQKWSHSDDIFPVLAQLKQTGYEIAALEQDPKSTKLNLYRAPAKVALVIGEEVNGISAGIIKKCDLIVEIPMFGKKESFNVAVAAAIGLSQLTL